LVSDQALRQLSYILVGWLMGIEPISPASQASALDH
jgi:hypothetical protein